MSIPDYEHLAVDLFTRTESAVEDVMRLAVDTGITFQVEDVVDAVERALPAGYPAPTVGGPTRRDMIARMAKDIISGEGYDED